MANRFQRLDNQAPAQSQLNASKPDVSRSAFDFSTVHSGNTLLYAVTPVDCFDVVPGEDLSISMANYLEFRNPSVRPLLNGFRVYFHAYYNRLDDLWEGAKNFLDTGRSGQISLNRPNLVYRVDTAPSSGFSDVNACTPMSLLNFLGLPVEAYTSRNNSMTSPLYQFQPAFSGSRSSGSSTVTITQELVAESPDFFPADCAFAYQRNWRDYYANKNLLQNNKFWFPDNEDHFILSYSCEHAVCINYENELLSSADERAQNIIGYNSAANAILYRFIQHLTGEPSNPISSTMSSADVLRYPNLSGLKFRQFKGDRFTTALPFPDLIRGDIPALTNNSTFSLDVSGIHVNVPSSFVTNRTAFTDANNVNHSANSVGIQIARSEGNEHSIQFRTLNNGSHVPLTSQEMWLVSSPVSTSASGTAQVSSSDIISLTQNDIRALETFTVFKERMARTNGDYNEMIQAQYGVNPHTHNRNGTYIGGFYQDFNLNVVTQTSESSDSSPLGSRSGVMTSNGSGNIGNFHVPDFGWIQIYMSIVHDVMYTQGIPRMFSKKIQTDMYFPIFNNLAPQAILNKELFVTGIAATDNDVFAYEDRYAEYKSRTNRVSGFMSLNHSLAAFDSARVMSRRFTSTPSLNSLFVTGVPENVDMEVFTVVDEPPFDFSCGISVRRVFPGPYTAIPGSLSSNLHA